MSLETLTLGERIVLASRFLTAEHLRQEADEAGINVRQLQNQMAVVRMNENPTQPSIRQDLYRQPPQDTEPKEAA
jgi:hypothetical protein